MDRFGIVGIDQYSGAIGTREAAGERSDLLRLAFVFQFARVVKGFVSIGDGDLVGEDENADVAEDGAC